MPTYILLTTWTDQGVKNAKDTVKRREQAEQGFQDLGGRIVATYWTQGAYDIVLIADFPDEASAMVALLRLGMQGNVRSETLRAFSADEMQGFLQRL